MNHSEKAKATLKEGFSCSQAVLATFCEELNLDRNTALKLTDAFGGGIGHMGLTCGAVTGACMVIGLRHGRTAAGDNEAKRITSLLVRELVEEFKNRNRTMVCKELMGCDLGTREGLLYAKEHDLRNTLCPKFVADATEILDEILSGE